MKKSSILVHTLLICLTCMATLASGRTSNIPTAKRHSDGTAKGGPSWSASMNVDPDGVSPYDSVDPNAQEELQGQLQRPISLMVHAATDMVNEGDSIQLTATVMLKDSTLRQPHSDSVVWTIISGPAVSISPSGVLTTDAVHQNEVIVFQGWYGGILATGVVIVLDSNKDNFGNYGSDGIDDDWQVGYFGDPPNEDASPFANPDGDPDNNLMEYLTGFDPTDGNQWFQLVIVDCDGSTSTLQMNKVIPGRRYTVQAGTDLTGFTETVTSLSTPVEELDMLVEDTGYSGQKKFYRVDVTRL